MMEYKVSVSDVLTAFDKFLDDIGSKVTAKEKISCTDFRCFEVSLAACPECTRLKKRQEGHPYCCNPNWANRVLGYEGLILDGPTCRGTDWVVYFAAKD